MRTSYLLLPVFILAPALLVLGCGAGAAGPQGPAGDPASIDIQRTTFSGVDETDVGDLDKRTLTFTKDAAETTVRVAYYDNLGAFSGSTIGKCGCRWEIEFDGASCSSPGAIYGEVFSVVSDQAAATTILGYCAGLPAKEMKISVRVGKSPLGSPPSCDCHTGTGGAAGVLEAEELR